MKLLLDTHLLIWAAEGVDRVPEKARILMADPTNELIFSAASIWEVAIKAGLNRPDFRLNARRLRGGLITNGYFELPIRSEHAAELVSLPPIHKDPFDRILVAQATIEGISLLTHDAALAAYGAMVLQI